MNTFAKICLVVFASMQLINSGFAARQQIGQFYWVEWEVDQLSSKITVQVEAQTMGYVGFGLARTPGVPLMDQADIIIGGVSDGPGTTYFSDRHGVGNTVPVLDDSQDSTFIEASQNGTHTRVKYSRPFVTGDVDDVDVILGFQTVIWSFGESDTHVYHGGINRGSFNLNWIQ